jgi:hypothetical protein
MNTRARPKNRTAASIPLAVQAMEGTFAPDQIGADALHEQLSYRAAGNPPGTLPTAAISNCFPGLEFDFRNIWKHIFKGIELHESDNLVVGTDPDPKLEKLRFRRLLKIHLGDTEHPLVITVNGPNDQGEQTDFGPNALEWSNALAYIVRAAGTSVRCDFTTTEADDAVGLDADTEPFELEVRSVFEPGSAVVARELLGPGDLTQSLCSPWQNDYRECACYYWAASRPDYVNVDAGPAGTSAGDNWMQVRGSGARQYQPDDFRAPGLLTYEDMFRRWEKVLRFEIQGRDTD